MTNHLSKIPVQATEGRGASANEAATPRPTLSWDIKRLRIRVETIKRYYVLVDGDWQSIYGGPFDEKSEAEQCIEDARRIDAQHPIQ